MQDSVILITGATDGIGLGTAVALARRGGTILVHGRSEVRLAAARAKILAETGNAKVETYQADFARLGDVRRLAAEVGARHKALHVLINNAGIGSGGISNKRRETSADGHELRFQVNHLAPFLLTHLLLPQLMAGALARVVNVASGAQAPIDFQDVMMEKNWEGFRAYSQSKLAMVMATFDLAAKLDAKQVTVNALHPGSLLDTKMVREGWGQPMGPVTVGIDSEVYVATHPELADVSGRYFDRTRPARASAAAYDSAARRRLWELSASLVQLPV